MCYKFIYKDCVISCYKLVIRYICKSKYRIHCYNVISWIYDYCYKDIYEPYNLITNSNFSSINHMKNSLITCSTEVPLEKINLITYNIFNEGGEGVDR